MFDELKQGIRDIQFLADPTVGEVRVGCPESMAAGFLPGVIDRMARQHPQITVHVVVAQTGEQEFRELRERSVDVMLGRLLRPVPDEEMAIEVLCKDKFFVVTGARNPWAARRKVTLSELSDERWILLPTDSLSGEYIAEAFRAEGVPLPRKCVTTFSLQTRMHLLATGRYFTVLQGSVLQFNSKRWLLKSLPIDLPLPPAPIAIFALKNRTLSGVIRSTAGTPREPRLCDDNQGPAGISLCPFRWSSPLTSAIERAGRISALISVKNSSLIILF